MIEVRGNVVHIQSRNRIDEMIRDEFVDASRLYQRYGQFGYETLAALERQELRWRGVGSSTSILGRCFDQVGQMGSFTIQIRGADNRYSWTGKSYSNGTLVESQTLIGPNSRPKETNSTTDETVFSDFRHCLGDAIARCTQAVEQPHWHFVLLAMVEGSIQTVASSEVLPWDPSQDGASRDLGDKFNAFIGRMQRSGWEIQANSARERWFDRSVRSADSSRTRHRR